MRSTLFLPLLLAAGARAWGTTGSAKDEVTTDIYALRKALFPLLIDWQETTGGFSGDVLTNITSLQTARLARLSNTTGCTPVPSCIIAASLITSQDQAILTNAFASSGASAEFLKRWPQYVNGTNRLLRVYGNGSAPLYPDIDSISYNATSSFYAPWVQQVRNWAVTGPPRTYLPPYDAIHLGLTFLDGNDRLDAISFPNLWTDQNAKAYEKSRQLNWSKYNYSAILIPGYGPDIDGVPLSPEGKLRVRIAMRWWLNGTAPFFLPSGGAVHPSQTHYVEAAEMKKYVLKEYPGLISEGDIVIEPHARHTTTNLRNSARELIKLGAPPSKPVLIITDGDQRNTIASPAFALRNIYELGYSIGDFGRNISYVGIEYYPNFENCTFYDPVDALDP